ncbi:conserved uncharacterized protein [Gardnerella vaginalis 5-1]|nr:conserved uncharacterized protein [Gardnerella vaginalis 5-1]
MLFPKLVCCSILSFPLFALLLVTDHPFVSVWIEAFWVLVVAFSIIFSWHTVESWIKIFRIWIYSFSSLLQGEGDATTIEINVDNLHEYFFATLNNSFWVLYVTVCKLRNVNQALNAIFNGDEHTELNNLCDLALNDLSRNMSASEALPWIFLSCLKGKGNTFAIEINVENLNGNLIANLNNLRWVIDVLPRKLRHVNETVNTAEVNKRTEVYDRRHNAFANLTLLKLREEGFANFGLGFLKELATRKHNIVAVLIELENLSLNLLANVWRKIAHATHLNQGSWQEAAKTDINNQAALNSFNNGTFNDAVCILNLLDVTPSTLILCTLLGENKTSFLVFLSYNKGFNGVANLDNIIWINVFFDGKFTGRNYTFSFVADVQQYFVVINLYDCTFN